MSHPISGTEPCHIGYPVAPGLTDADRAGPLLHWPDPRDPRGSRARRCWHQDGFHGPRARKGNHHPVHCHLLHLEGVPGPFVLFHPLLI